MTLYTPNSMIRFCQIPLENDYKHQFKFKTIEDQIAYFDNKVIKSYNNATFIRTDSAIKLSGNFDEMMRYNYCFYQNPNFGTKRFYAYVTSIEYIAQDTVKIYLELDVFQTYQFDLTYNKCFVEREHTNQDEIGFNTVPENLEIGEYVIQERIKDTNLMGNMKLVIQSTVNPAELFDDYGAVYNGIYSGVKYYTYPIAGLDIILNSMASNGKIDAITGMFYAPEWLIPQSGGGDINESSGVYSYEIDIGKILNLSGYVPKNNKCLTFPYCAVVVSNANGSSAIYHPNEWDLMFGSMKFKVIGALSVGCSIKIYPYDYKGLYDNIDEGINLGKFPSVNWATDQFTNWLTQNAVNVATNLVGSGVQIIGGTMMMGGGATGMAGAGSIASGVSGIANVLNEVHKASLVPPQSSGNINSGDVVASSNNNTFHIYKMVIKDEFARIVDDYFTMFGYKTNRIKIPNITGRKTFNFIKTIDCNIDASIPQDHLSKIRNIFNSGITLWHDPEKIHQYSEDNSIIS